jgi:hypothetical protein
LKGKWSMWRRQGFHSTLTVSFILRRYPAHSPNWYNPSLIFTCTNGGERNKGSQRLRFWRFMPKREKILSPKQKDCTTNLKKIEMKIYLVFTNVCFSIGITNEALIYIFHWYLCHDNISIDILILRKQNLKWYCFETSIGIL